MRIIPKTVWLLACFFVDPNTKIFGLEEGGCIGIVFIAFIVDLPFSFLALVHFLLALIIFPFRGTNLRRSCLCCTAFSFISLLTAAIWLSECCLISPTVILSKFSGKGMNCIGKSHGFQIPLYWCLEDLGSYLLDLWRLVC